MRGTHDEDAENLAENTFCVNAFDQPNRHCAESDEKRKKENELLIPQAIFIIILFQSNVAGRMSNLE